MKISVVPSLFDRIPGLCIGIVAVRAQITRQQIWKQKLFAAAAARKPICC